MARDPLTAPAVRRERRRPDARLRGNGPRYRHVHHLDFGECVWLDAREHMRASAEELAAERETAAMTDEEFERILAIMRGDQPAGALTT